MIIFKVVADLAHHCLKVFRVHEGQFLKKCLQVTHSPGLALGAFARLPLPQLTITGKAAELLPLQDASEAIPATAKVSWRILASCPLALAMEKAPTHSSHIHDCGENSQGILQYNHACNTFLLVPWAVHCSSLH